MRHTVIVIILSIMPISCGISYTVPRATLHIDLIDASQLETTRGNISWFLLSKGFEDLGKDEEMLDLLQWNSKRHEGGVVAETYGDLIDRIHRTRHFKNEDINVAVIIVDYSDKATKKRFANYSKSESQIADSPSVELNIYNYRPGGFSDEAHNFYNELALFLSSIEHRRTSIIFSPPETDQSEFYRVSTINLLSRAIWWLAVYLLSIGMFGFIVAKLLNRTNLTVGSKRALFTLLGTILATPLPFPAATIFVVILPSVLAIPAIGSGYLFRVQDFAIPSFITSAAFCALISFYLVWRKDV